MTLSLWITWITSVCIRRIIKWRILLTCHPSRCCSIASASTTCASNFLISTSIYTLTLVLNMIWVAFIGIRSHPSWIAILSWHPGRSCSTPTSPNAATISSSCWVFWAISIHFWGISAWLAILSGHPVARSCSTPTSPNATSISSSCCVFWVVSICFELISTRLAILSGHPGRSCPTPTSPYTCLIYIMIWRAL